MSLHAITAVLDQHRIRLSSNGQRVQTKTGALTNGAMREFWSIEIWGNSLENVWPQVRYRVFEVVIIIEYEGNQYQGIIYWNNNKYFFFLYS